MSGVPRARENGSTPDAGPSGVRGVAKTHGLFSAAGRLVLFAVLVVQASTLSAHTEISASDAHDMILGGGDVIVLDVREYSEFCGTQAHIENAVILPWNSDVLVTRYSELPVGASIIVLCAFGGRSHPAADFLESRGFSSVYDMLGGMSVWQWETELCDAEPIVRVNKPGSRTEIDWTPTTGVQDYDLLRGLVGDLAEDPGLVDLGLTDCLADDTPFTFLEEPDSPSPGESYFYLGRRRDGSWGQSSQGDDRVPGSEDCGLP